MLVVMGGGCARLGFEGSEDGLPSRVDGTSSRLDGSADVSSGDSSESDVRVDAAPTDSHSIDGLVNDSSVDLPAADLPAADLPAADLPAADLPAADLPAADLPAADLGVDALVIGTNPVHLWSTHMGSVDYDQSYDIAVDASGNIFVIGTFRGTVDFGGGPRVSAGARDIFLASYTSGGAHRWSKRFGGLTEDFGQALTVDRSGNVTITGYFEGTADFGSGPFTSAGRNDIFVASYDSNGVHRWSKRFGGSTYDGGYALAVDGSDNVIVSGQYWETMTFGGSPVTNKNESSGHLPC
ncbi:MAG: hypothetical protein JRH20_20460 [Deltaproteobacteria bacterium]|nr:hypothetical protein [Deltaproteobacteria bacterium]